MTRETVRQCMHFFRKIHRLLPNDQLLIMFQWHIFSGHRPPVTGH